MEMRPLTPRLPAVSRLGYGAFKIGRNQGAKYADDYDLPDLDAVQRLMRGLRILRVNYFDTAPAYGLSEERLGLTLPAKRTDLVVSTKVGETFEDGASTYDYSRAAVEMSLERSRARLGTDVLDLVFVHSNGDDEAILDDTDVVPVLREQRERGVIRAIGFSGKTVAGAERALAWADALMVEYHLEDRSHEGLIADAAARGVGIVVKKGLASGRLPAREAIEFVLANRGVTTLVVGGLNFRRMAENIATAESLAPA